MASHQNGVNGGRERSLSVVEARAQAAEAELMEMLAREEQQASVSGCKKKGRAKPPQPQPHPLVSVFVRVRPLTPAERAKGFQPLDGLALQSSAPDDAGATVVLKACHECHDSLEKACSC